MNKIKVKKTGETCYYEKLKNGLEIYLLPNNKVKNFYITLSTKFGSIHTDFKIGNQNHSLPKGVAHFLEHILFNMPDGTNAFDYFSAIGSSINAFTSYDVTCYEVYANTKFKENLSYLLEYVYTPYFTKEIVAGEKGIIIEEIKQIKDNPSSELLYGMFRNIFVKDAHQYLISGTIDDIKKITLEDVKLAYDTFYPPENMFLIITGNFNPEEAIAITTETLKDYTFPKYQKPVIKKVKEPFKVTKEYEEITLPVDKEKITIGIKIPKSNFKALKLSDLELKMYLNLIMRINYGNTSQLKEELTSNGIITESISTFLTVTDEYIIQAIISSTEYPEYYIKRIQEVFSHLQIDQQEIDRKIKSSISNLIMSFDEIEVVNNDIQDDIVSYGKYINDIYLYYRRLNYETAKKVIEKLDKYVISITVLKPQEKQ